jgi:hypothetical protein
LLRWRNLVCVVMVVALPASMIAQDSSRAMLHSEGGVWLNGNPAPSSSAIFTHDLIQTQKESRAKIDVYGTTVEVQPETIVQFEGDELVLDHGSLLVDTSYLMRVRVNCLTVTPLAQAWTRYDVTDVDGKVTVAAHENNVLIHYQGAAVRQSKQAAFADVTVYHGEQATREERCGAAPKPSDAIDGKPGILDNNWAKAAGVAAIAILACLGLCHTDDALSPAKP